MTSWWRLRTHAYLVLGVLLFLIVFLGAYALNEAKRHAIEADELLGTNYRAASILKKTEIARSEELRTAAKYRVTGDEAYKTLLIKQHEKVYETLNQLLETLSEDDLLVPLVQELLRIHKSEKGLDTRTQTIYSQAVRDIEQSLEDQRAQRLEHVQVVARDLGKIIFVAFLIAIGVTSWLAMMLYQAVLKPIESIKRAAHRIREGELSYRIEKFRGFAELTDLRREFNAMASKLEELDSMKSDFLSTVSHELKTPLTAVKEGLNFLTEKQGTLPPQISARTLEVCNQSVKRLETMIHNLLNHAKMESGFYSFDERPKDFVAVVESAIQGLKPIAERRGMNINFVMKSLELKASFSTDGISHAVENLLLNAIKYGDASAPIVIEVRRMDTKPVPQLEVRVTNHGKSLLPAELTQVFERFFRASNADGQKGVGIGLSVVKRIIEAHHGTVEAESHAGITTFMFRIPQRYQSEALVRRPAGPSVHEVAV